MSNSACSGRWSLLSGAVALSLLAGPALAADPVPQSDLLNAELWMQRSVEYKANALAVYALGRIQLDKALADRNWTAATEQTGNYQDLPPAVVLDLDETAMDNSAYQAGLVTTNGEFSPKTWDAWVKAEKATAVPGAVEFTQYAESKGVKVFYVTNRNADQEEPTRRNAQALGFPMGGNVDTFLMSKEKPDWGSAKGTRRAYIAKDYRIILLFGDNFGDFSDAYNGSEADRLKAFEAVKEHFGRDWLMLANPGYGSFESAPYGHNFKLSADEKRAKKIGALEPWVAPAQ
ncbi:acid phosphatase [Azospirillum lipoferum]|uniref:5-nucleotide phosphatase n=1 Tax=Azospirillum lipoferum TaxID=193 RepID=A0A5A9G778_AZOLI|nr:MULTISPECIES: HAD family acid phosphatase [Azospirillum]KAA0590378.1 5-nucleotide phosphatase [Azospirillum lipoferum]MCP1614790.1 acid phosphatase [Azospirillum lipoferum]MDW5532245.1 HAD family acid phosphatase [Azospirillum sp. NL1]